MEHSLWHLLFHMYLLNHIMKILLLPDEIFIYLAIPVWICLDYLF